MSKKSKKKSINFFISNSRLTKYQRKYCHCLMKSRSKKKNHYGKCINIFKNKIDRTKTNCFMNYDLEKYSIEEVRLLCNERMVKLYYIKNKKKKYYTKKGLINKLLEKKFMNQKKNINHKNITSDSEYLIISDPKGYGKVKDVKRKTSSKKKRKSKLIKKGG